MSELDGRVAVITGGARGQGAAAARRFVDEGAHVVIGDVRDDLGKEFADSLGDAASYRHLDVSQEQEWAALIDEVMAQFGRIDILVNNAGILRFAPLPEMSLAEYLEVVNINQVGTFLGMRAVCAPMIAAGKGSIINVSSVEGLAGMPMLAAYTGSKFAIRGMTKVAALELGPKGIRVNSVHPGMIETDMVKDAAGGHDVDLNPIANKRIALRRLGQADDVAELVLFLASDRSSYCTGGEFTVDGGATATHAFYLG